MIEIFLGYISIKYKRNWSKDVTSREEKFLYNQCQHTQLYIFLCFWPLLHSYRNIQCFAYHDMDPGTKNTELKNSLFLYYGTIIMQPCIAYLFTEKQTLKQ